MILKLNNQRGLSLVEILGAIVIIGIILTMLGTIVVQASRNTRDNEMSDRAVNLSRNFAEELKYTIRNLKVQQLAIPAAQMLRIADIDAEVPVSVPLLALWNTGHKEIIAIPNAANPQYTIEVELFHVASDGSITIPNPRPTSGSPSSISIDPYSGFRKAVITTTSTVTGKSYSLEALIDY